jgi:hypothetical protein
MLRHTLRSLAFVAVLLATGTAPAFATTGYGCFRIANIPQTEPLNLRAGPSAKSEILGRFFVGQHGIIAENGPCRPANRPPSKQWCPVKIYDGDMTMSGWFKMAFLQNTACP